MLVFPPCSSDNCNKFFRVRNVGVWSVLLAGIVQLKDIDHFKQALADLMFDDFSEFDKPNDKHISMKMVMHPVLGLMRMLSVVF